MQELSFGSVLRIEHEENTEGCDFIVGDLHGSVHLLNKFMHIHGFDESVDRMFSVGDLVDRGKDSIETLKLLQNPWFFPVLGNHEQMFYSYAKKLNDGYGYSFLNNGGDWYERIPVEAPEFALVQELADDLLYVPRVRTIKGKNKVHIVHAEFNVRGKGIITDADIEDDEKLKMFCMLSSFDGEYSFWGRSLFHDLYNRDPEMVSISREKAEQFSSPDLSTIVSGHTIMNRPVKIGKCLNIDTGAYAYGRKLTVYNVTHDTLYQVSEFPGNDLDKVEPYIFTA